MSTSKKLALAAFTFAATILVPLAAFAQDDRAGSNLFDVRAWAAVGAGLAIGLAVLGGALGQGRAAAAALEGSARNPGASARIQTPMFLASRSSSRWVSPRSSSRSGFVRRRGLAPTPAWRPLPRAGVRAHRRPARPRRSGLGRQRAHRKTRPPRGCPHRRKAGCTGNAARLRHRSSPPGSTRICRSRENRGTGLGMRREAPSPCTAKSQPLTESSDMLRCLEESGMPAHRPS
jgi:F-type H+-transporting ATPase subunit c